MRRSLSGFVFIGKFSEYIIPNSPFNLFVETNPNPKENKAQELIVYAHLDPLLASNIKQIRFSDDKYVSLRSSKVGKM